MPWWRSAGCSSAGAAAAQRARLSPLSRWTARALALALVAGLGLAGEARAQATAGAAAPCEAWPGELRPLPTTEDSDPFLAGWARQRAADLAQRAQALEPEARALAAALWRHAACLAPRRGDYADAARGVALVRVYRPPIVPGSEAPLEPTTFLEAPVSVASAGRDTSRAAPPRLAPTPAREARPAPATTRAPEPPPAPESARLPAADPEPPPAPPQTARVAPPRPAPTPPVDPAPVAPPIPEPAPAAAPEPDRLAAEALAEGERALLEARFESALDWSARGRARLADRVEGGADGALSDQRARLEVVAATAALALGRDADARRSAAAALAADPLLTLDPLRHSPKVLSLFESVRQDQASAP